MSHITVDAVNSAVIWLNELKMSLPSTKDKKNAEGEEVASKLRRFNPIVYIIATILCVALLAVGIYFHVRGYVEQELLHRSGRHSPFPIFLFFLLYATPFYFFSGMIASAFGFISLGKSAKYPAFIFFAVASISVLLLLVEWLRWINALI